MRSALPFLLYWIFFPGLAQNYFSPEDSLIRYKGRWSFEIPSQPSASMNGTSIEWAFEGTGSSIELSTASKTVFLYVIVDGQADVFDRQLIQVSQSSPQQFQLVQGLEPGVHHIEIIQLSEYDSKLVFHQLSVEDGSLVDLPPRKPLKLEFYGDSNTAGWNAWNAYDNGGAEVSEAYFIFPGMVAEMLNAEYNLIGVSGSGITNRTWLNLANHYDRIHVTEQPSEQNQWNFQNNYWDFTPDAVVINLGANDYYAGAPKPIIKQEWKKFVTDKLRKQYPSAHIVFANSYGWAVNEPADYVEEAVNELKEAGDPNVSFVKFPWLWGQQHAVINEHAGFANILAKHLSEILEVELNQLNELSSLSQKVELYNPGFEKSILPNVADGWRPTGETDLISTTEALEGEKVIKVSNGGSVHAYIWGEPGNRFRFSVSGKGASDLSDGFVKILFKNQGQQTIKTSQIRPDFSTDWQTYEVEGTAPTGTWAIWFVLESSKGSEVFFDQAFLEPLEPLGTKSPQIKIYPNPFRDILKINGQKEKYVLNVYNSSGILLQSIHDSRSLDTSGWKDGLYILHVPEFRFIDQFLKISGP